MGTRTVEFCAKYLAIILAVFSLNAAILIENAKALSLVGDEAALLSPELLRGREGLIVSQLELPGTFSDLEEALSPIYKGEDLDLPKIGKIKEAIYRYYQERGSPLVLVSIPRQKIVPGVLQLVVAPSRLESLSMEERHQPLLKPYFKLEKGEPIDHRKITQNIHRINRNPYRHVDLIYSPGLSPRTTAISFVVTEKRPYQFYVGADNTGVQETQKGRFFLGFGWGKTWGFDHLFNGRYTSSPDGKTFRALNAQYVALFPAGSLSFHGGYSFLLTSLQSVKREGHNSQASLQYTFPLKPFGNFSHTLSLGIDFKRIESILEYPPLRLEESLNATQLGVHYSGTSGAISIDAAFFGSPGKWLPQQQNYRFASLSPGARNRWAYLRTSLKFALPRFQTLLQGQLAFTPLLPSEQMSLGGVDSIRGYEEHQINANSAFLLSLELKAPPFSIASRDALELLAFFDCGGAPFLAGVGPALRYTFDPYLVLHLDLGIPLPKSNPRLHFSCIAKF